MAVRNILVTGASRGIGFETALHLHKAGHTVIATSRSESGLNRLTNISKGSILAIDTDLTRPESAGLIEEVLNREGIRLDGLVHNAGKLVNKPFEELNDDEWMEMLQVHLLGPVRLTRRVLPLLNPGSHIVTIGSMGGYQQSRKFPGLCGYSVSKGALAIFSECLAVELQEKKISVNCLCPGAVETEMFRDAFPGLEAPVRASEMGAYISRFVLESHKLYNGKILPVALSDPG